MWLTSLTLAFQLTVATGQIQNPPYIPVWSGPEPIKYCVSQEMEPYREEVVRAVKTWEPWVWTAFVETKDCGGMRTITYSFAVLQASIGYTQYPPPLFPEPWAGDVWIDRRLPWYVPQTREYLLPLLIHETGHALGLGESYNPEDVMFPFVGKDKKVPTLREQKMMLCLYRGMCSWQW